MRTLRRSIVGTALISALGLVSDPGWSQGSPQSAIPTFEQHLEVREILVEVVVTTRSGVPVLGLQEEDFVVELEGRSIAIQSLSYHRWGRDSGSAVPDSAEEAELDPGKPDEGFAVGTSLARHRYFILLFHDLLFLNDKGTLGVLSQRMRAGRGVRKWIAEYMQDGDLVAVARYDSRLHLFQDFTADREELLEALERVLTRVDEPTPVPVSPGPASLARYLPTGRELVDESTDFKRALRLLAEAGGHTPGRKHVLLFSIGTDLAGSSKRALFDEPGRPSAVELLQHHDLIVYPLDLSPRGVEHARLADLVDLAIDTGGMVFTQVDAFHKPLRTITNSLAGFYLLALSLEVPPTRDGALELEIETRRRGLETSYRQTILTRTN